MNKIFSVAGAALLSVGMTSAQAQFDRHPTHVDLLDSCHKGLVVWLPLPPARKCGQVQFPQVKVFDRLGRLRFIGSALDAIKWAKAGQPVTSIPAGVVSRDAGSDARIDHVPPPVPGLGWVAFYATNDCPPCQKQFATFQSEVMPKLDRGTALSLFEVADPGDLGQAAGKP